MIKLPRPCEITVGFTPKMRAIVPYDSVRDSELGEDLFCDIHNDATWRWIWQLSDDRVLGVVISDYHPLVSFKLKQIRCQHGHGLDGISCCSRCSGVSDFWCSCQTLQVCPSRSIYLLMFNQYTVSRASSFVFSVPTSAVCSCRIISGWCIRGMTS